MSIFGYTEDHWTSLMIDAIPIPREADWDISEKWGFREFGQLEPNLNAVMRHMYGTNPAESQKFDISWSCSQGRRMPVLSKIFRGKQIQVVPIKEMYDAIEPGATTCRLARDAHEGSVILFDDLIGEDPLVEDDDYSIDGRLITISGEREGRVIVGFRPVLTMLVDKWNYTWAERTRMASWDLEAREV